MNEHRMSTAGVRRPLFLLQWGGAVFCAGIAFGVLFTSSAGLPPSFNAASQFHGQPGEVDFRGPEGSSSDAAAAYAASGTLPALQTPPHSHVQQEEGAVGTAAAVGAAAGPRKNNKDLHKPLALATALGLMMAAAGFLMPRKKAAAAGETRSADETMKKLTELMPAAKKLSEAAGTVDSTISFKFLKSAISVLEETQQALKASKADADRKPREKEFELHVGESISALRFIQKAAQEQAKEMLKQAKETLPPSVPADKLGKVEAVSLNADLVKAYVTLRLALEKSAQAQASLAGEGAANLQKIPLLECEDDAKVIFDSETHMGFVKLTGSGSKIAGKTIASTEVQMIVAHREHLVNTAVCSFTKIEELHASLKGYRLLAEEAVSGANKEQASKLNAFIEAVEGLEQEFQKLPSAFRKLRSSESLAVSLQVASDLTGAQAIFVKQRSLCMQRLEAILPVLKELKPSEDEALELLDAALSGALEGSKVDYKSMTAALKTARDHREKMAKGEYLGHRRPLVSTILADTILSKMEAMEEEISALNKEVKNIVGKGAEGLTAAEAQKRLAEAYVVRQKLAEHRSKMEDLSSQYMFFRSLENQAERCVKSYDAAQANYDKEAHSHAKEEILKFGEQFREEMQKAAASATLADLATAVASLREKADSYTKFMYRLDNPAE